MKVARTFAVAALLACMTACGDLEQAAKNSSTATADRAGQGAMVYSGKGTVKAIFGNQVTIAHGPIEGIGWPAMTMSFTAPPRMAQGIQSGDSVSFQFRQDGSAYTLTSLSRG